MANKSLERVNSATDVAWSFQEVIPSFSSMFFCQRLYTLDLEHEKSNVALEHPAQWVVRCIISVRASSLSNFLTTPPAETSNQRTFSSIAPGMLSWRTLDRQPGWPRTKPWRLQPCLWVLRTSSPPKSWRCWTGVLAPPMGSSVTGGRWGS